MESNVVHDSNVLLLSTNALVAELKQCGKKKALQRGKALHSKVIEAGCHRKTYVANTLISMYSKCGSMHDAQKVFESMVQRDVVSWTALLTGYVDSGQSLAALDVFSTMDCVPDRVTFVAALKACASLANGDISTKKACLEKGVAIHRQARESGLENDTFVASILVDMYSKYGNMGLARESFENMTHRDVVSWTTLIVGYVENGDSHLALETFSRMDCQPNTITFVAALKACASLAAGGMNKRTCLQKGQAIHKQVLDAGMQKDIFVASILVDMYSKCGDMTHAREVFDGMWERNAVSWTALIVGYIENGENLVALKVFELMDCQPDGFTLVSGLKACGGLAAEGKLDKGTCLEKGLAIHGRVREFRVDGDVYVASALVDMYCKCGDMQGARDVFEKMKNRDVVTWTSLIIGYIENGESSMALDLFNTMDCPPDGLTFVAALKACACIGALEVGQKIHDRVCELRLEQDDMVATCLVDFYGKCGNMQAAEEVFNRMKTQNTVSWNALIGGYSLLGDTSSVFGLLKRMQEAARKMDSVTMHLVFTTCSHAGKVEEGQRCFESMSKHGIAPTLEHYTCMVDMLGRANRLQEALSLVRAMPFQANSAVWMALLGACRKWSDVEVAKVAFCELVVDGRYKREDVAGAYVLMRNIYERLGMHDEKVWIEGKEKARKPGRTHWCDVQGRTYSFTAGGVMEPEIEKQFKALLCDDCSDELPSTEPVLEEFRRGICSETRTRIQIFRNGKWMYRYG